MKKFKKLSSIIMALVLIAMSFIIYEQKNAPIPEQISKQNDTTVESEKQPDVVEYEKQPDVAISNECVSDPISNDNDAHVLIMTNETTPVVGSSDEPIKQDILYPVAIQNNEDKTDGYVDIPEKNNTEIIDVPAITVICPAYADETAELTEIQLYNNPNGYNYYDQLTVLEKELYQQVATMLSNNLTDTVIDFDPGEPITAATADALGTNLGTMVKNAVFSFMRDNPQYFWINGYSFGYQYYPTSPVKLASATITLIYHESYTTDSVTGYYNDLIAAVNSYHIYGTNDYEILKSIHDSLISLVRYDPYVNTPGLANAYAHQPVGALTGSHVAVCEGYAEAFKLLCDRENIPCVLVSGDSHMWNYVQMKDGNWYMIDTTWDDGKTITYYDYFLVGLGTTLPHFSSKSSCAIGHTEAKLSDGVDYPVLHTGDYSMLLINNTKTTQMSIDETNGYIFVMSGQDIASTFTVKSGSLTYTGNKTGDTVTYTNGNDSKVYTVIMYGDVNCDGIVDEDDYQLIKVVMFYPERVTYTQYLAADVCKDTAVDGFDAFELDRFINGFRPYFTKGS